MAWGKDCIISEISRNSEINADPDTNLLALAAAATGKNYATFQISNIKLFVSGVNLYVNHNIKFLENVKQGCKRTFSWKTIDLK